MCSARRLRFSYLAALAANVLATPAYAGAWMQAPNEALVILSSYAYQSNQRFDNSSHRVHQPNYTQVGLNPYVEYGLREDITIGANLFFIRAAQSGAPAQRGQSNFGIGDSEFFLRKKLWQKDGFALSLQPFIKLPSPQSSTSDTPKLGSSHPDLGASLSGGYGFSAFGQNHFIEITPQYRYRFGPQRNQLNAAATLGVHVTEKWMLMPQLFLTSRTSERANATFTQSSADDYDATRAQLSAVYDLRKDVSVQFGGFTDLNGRNAGRGQGILFALWKRL